MKQEIKVTKCYKCELSHHRMSIVNGQGEGNNKIMFIGEAPGYQENKLGIPFIGPAGRLLRQIITKLDFMHLVYFTNVVRCYPGRRAPTLREINNCTPYLTKEINVVNPAIICLLGNTAIRSFYGKEYGNVNKTRGKAEIINNRVIISTFHPSYVLRAKDNDVTNLFVQDLMKIHRIYKRWLKLKQRYMT